MTTNVLVTFYSTYGHVHRMALAVAEGAESVPDSTVQLRRIAELEDARKAASAQDAYVRAQQAQANIPVVTHGRACAPAVEQTVAHCNRRACVPNRQTHARYFTRLRRSQGAHRHSLG